MPLVIAIWIAGHFRVTQPELILKDCRLAYAPAEMHNGNMATGWAVNKQQVFKLLLFFRWFSLVPPLAVGFLEPTQPEQERYYLAFFFAFLINILISILTTSLKRKFENYPWIVGADFLFVTGLLAITGGWRSPYYLYALSPILVAALFFQVRGALIGVSAFLPLYFIAIFVDKTFFNGSDPEWLVVTVFVIGSYLIAVTVGYLSQLLNELQDAQDTLYRTHQELTVLQELSNSLQLTTSLDEVQKQALIAITKSLGFERAMVGLIADETQIIGVWQEQERNHHLEESKRELSPVVLTNRENPINQAIRQKQTIQFHLTKDPLQSSLAEANASSIREMAQFEIYDGLALPLLWGNQTIGILLVDLEGHTHNTVDVTVIEAIARQTAVTLGMMMTRLRHAKESAIQEERTRIALDLHDSISQSLFGLVYTLQGCMKLLQENPLDIEPELDWALATAQDVRKKIRATIHNMWPAELTAEQFEQDLRTYAADVLQAAELDITFDIRGEFNTLSPPVRRGMYRICQESLTNIVHHAAAGHSRICVDVADGRARIILRDNGRGFKPDVALAQNFNGDHFGLRGMRERAAALGGTCEIFSQPGAGTSILIDIPANMQAHHE